MTTLVQKPISPLTCHSERSEESIFLRASGNPVARSERSFGLNRRESVFLKPRGQGARYGSSGSSSSTAGFVTGGFLAVAAAAVFGGGDTGFVTEDFVTAAPDCFATTFATTKYFRILSSRFGPIPRTASKSSTLLNAPYDLRICKILSAVDGPIPGTCCNCSDVAVFKLTGAAGGFFFAAVTTEQNSRQTARGTTI